MQYLDRNGTEITDGDFLLVAYEPQYDSAGYHISEVAAYQNENNEIELWQYCKLTIWGERRYVPHEKQYCPLENYKQCNIQILGNVFKDPLLLDHKPDLPRGVYSEYSGALRSYGYKR